MGAKEELLRTCPCAFLNTGDAEKLVGEWFEPNVKVDGERSSSALTMNGETAEDGRTVPATLASLLVAGRSALNTGGGSTAGAGVGVRLCVMRIVGTSLPDLALIVAGEGFEGEILAFKVDQGAMFCPICTGPTFEDD